MRRGWLHLASGAGVGRLLGFVSNLLLSRWLGPTELGLFNLVTTTVQTSDTLVRCGGDYALNFELGDQPEATQTERGVQLARGLAQLCSLMTALICLGVGLWVWWGQGLFPTSLEESQRLILTGLLLVMIACEGSAAAAWEVLLVSHRTAPLALRQGLFFPLRILIAAIGARFGGVLGAMSGWSIIALVQCLWLKFIIGHLWTPLRLLPPLWSSVYTLLARGLPFYGANLLASVIFYPLLLKVATASGLSEIGYLRVGQILQQLFAFLPATLVPVLFLKLRSEPTFRDQVILLERPMRIIWIILLGALFGYCAIDSFLISAFFGKEYLSALPATRILLVTALFESLLQLIVQPFLAAGHTREYSKCQNISALVAAALGWLWIPVAGLNAYLIVRLLYVLIPFLGFGTRLAAKLVVPKAIISLFLLTLFWLAVQFLEIYNLLPSTLSSVLACVSLLMLFAVGASDIPTIRKLLAKNPRS